MLYATAAKCSSASAWAPTARATGRCRAGIWRSARCATRAAAHGRIRLTAACFPPTQSWEACAARELEEETGIRLAEPPVFAAVNNSVMSATKCERTTELSATHRR